MVELSNSPRKELKHRARKMREQKHKPRCTPNCIWQKNTKIYTNGIIRYSSRRELPNLRWLRTRTSHIYNGWLEKVFLNRPIVERVSSHQP